MDTGLTVKKPAASFLGSYGPGTNQERLERPRMVRTEQYHS